MNPSSCPLPSQPPLLASLHHRTATATATTSATPLDAREEKISRNKNSEFARFPEILNFHFSSKGGGGRMGRKEMVSHSSLSSESLYSTSRFYHRVQLSPFRSFYRSILSISLSFFGNTNATFFRSLKEGNEMKFRFSIENLFIFIYIYIFGIGKKLWNIVSNIVGNLFPIA